MNQVSVDAKAIIQNIIIALLTAAGLFCSLLLLTYSWVKIAAMIAILLPGTVWLVTHGRVRKVSKYVVIGALIFAIGFASFESYMFSNAGYPSPAAVQSTGTAGTAGYMGILSISLNRLIQGIEKSPTYALLSAEHGKTNPESIKLDSPEWIEVDFYGEGSNTYLPFIAPYPGDQYHVQVETYSGQLFSSSYVQSSSQQAFSQIDGKGLSWFYDRALELAQNRTGTTPKIDSLSVTMTVEDEIYLSYEGVTVQIKGSYQGQGTLICDFEPDGTLIYMSLPTVT